MYARFLRAIQLTIGLVVRLCYRVRVRGLGHVPAEGAAVLVANHVTYADALILGGLCPRPVRFVVDHRIHDAWPLRWFFRLARAIPIASRRQDPTRLAAALDAIDQALANGELVGIFPEGKLTRDGSLQEFKPGIEAILARQPAPVVPIALDGLWGSSLSYAAGKPFAALPRLRARVQVTASPALPAACVTAEDLRERVAAMLGSPIPTEVLS